MLQHVPQSPRYMNLVLVLMPRLQLLLCEPSESASSCLRLFWHASMYFGLSRFVSVCLGLPRFASIMMARFVSVCLGLSRFASVCLGLPRVASVCLGLPRFASVCLGSLRFASGYLGVCIYASICPSLLQELFVASCGFGGPNRFRNRGCFGSSVAFA